MREQKAQQDRLADLCERLGSANGVAQYQAFLEAQELPTDQLLLLVSTQSRRLHKRQRRETWGLFGCLSMPLLLLAGKVALWMGSANFFWWFIGVLACMLFCSSALVGATEDVRLRRRLSRLLQPQEDTRFVSPALLLYHDKDADTRSNAREALLRLLPQLRLEETRQWDTIQRASLFDILRTPWNDVEVTLCALQTIAQAVDIDLEYEKEERRLLMRLLPITASESITHSGSLRNVQDGLSDEDDVRRQQLLCEAERRGHELNLRLDQKMREMEEAHRTIENERREFDPYAYVLPRSDKQAWFAKSNPNTSGEYCFDNGNDRAQEVREAAKQCVGAVLARMAQRQKADTLLRPVEMATDGEQTLLRPAAENDNNTPSGQLLRATQQQQ